MLHTSSFSIFTCAPLRNRTYMGCPNTQTPQMSRKQMDGQNDTQPQDVYVYHWTITWHFRCFSPVFAAKSRGPIASEIWCPRDPMIRPATAMGNSKRSSGDRVVVKVRDGRIPNILMVQKSGNHQLRLVVYPFIYKVLPPSQVVGNGISGCHQQYGCWLVSVNVVQFELTGSDTGKNR